MKPVITKLGLYMGTDKMIQEKITVCSRCRHSILITATIRDRRRSRVICGGPNKLDGCWQDMGLVKKRGRSVNMIMGRRIAREA